MSLRLRSPFFQTLIYLLLHRKPFKAHLFIECFGKKLGTVLSSSFFSFVKAYHVTVLICKTELNSRERGIEREMERDREREIRDRERESERERGREIER